MCVQTFSSQARGGSSARAKGGARLHCNPPTDLMLLAHQATNAFLLLAQAVRSRACSYATSPTNSSTTFSVGRCQFLGRWASCTAPADWTALTNLRHPGPRQFATAFAEHSGWPHNPRPLSICLGGYVVIWHWTPSNKPPGAEHPGLVCVRMACVVAMPFLGCCAPQGARRAEDAREPGAGVLRIPARPRLGV